MSRIVWPRPVYDSVKKALFEFRRADDAAVLLRAHIESSGSEVRKITLHRLHTAKMKAAGSRKPAAGRA